MLERCLRNRKPMSAQDRPPVDANDKQWWESLYKTEFTPWELNSPAPPFVSFLNSQIAVQPGKMLVPGCGTGNECLLFATHGFEVTGVDFAPSATLATTAKFQQAGLLGSKGIVLQHDFFDMHEYDASFDYVLEHTCFCAIHPSRRQAYARTVRDLLRPGGKLIGLWWLVDSKSGPPFKVTREDVLNTFSEFFRVEVEFTPKDSVPDRQSKELFAVMSTRS